MKADNEHVEHQERVWRIGIATTALASLVLFVYVAWASRLLRPGADDYCFAVYADRGVIGGLVYWFQDISGYSTFLFGALAFVGWPLRNMPFAIASAIPFIIAALAVGVAGSTVLWSSSLNPNRTSLFRTLTCIPAIAVAWWAFLWLPVSQGADGITRWMANGLTHWQTLNGTYVFQTAWLLTALVLLWFQVGSQPRWMWAFLPLGLLLGFGGAALVGTIAAVGVLYLTYTWIASTGAKRQRQLSTLLLLMGALVGGLASHFAPGTQSRSEILGTAAPTSIRAIGELVNGTLPFAITLWIESFTHSGALLVGVAGVAVGLMIVRSGYGFAPARGLAVAVSLFGISLVASLVSRFTELFAYDGYWHFIPTWLLSFLGILSVSISIGAWLSRRSWNLETPVMLAVLAIAILATVGALATMTTSMAARALAWETGPATLPGMISDLENPAGMEIACWRELGSMRDLPSRGSY